MKIIIASDIHGSYTFCEKLFNRVDREGADLVLLLGDLLYHGPRNDLPMEYNCKKVAALLNSYREKIVAVKGNCDSEVDQMMLDFPILAESAIVHADGITILASHGHKMNPKAPFPTPEGSVVAFGHTHIPTDMVIGDIRYLNPGSVSIPKSGSERGYILFENGEFFWKNLDGQIVIPEK